MLSVGSEVIKKFEAITLRSYRGEEGNLTPGQFFQGDWLLKALILPTVSMQWSDMGRQKQKTLDKKSLVMLTSPTRLWYTQPGHFTSGPPGSE